MKRILFLVLMAVLTTITVSAGTKTVYRNAIVLAYSPTNSVYEDDNIKLEIYDEQVWITNKTEKTVFLDLSQCFMVHNGSSSPLYERASNQKDDKKASKTKVPPQSMNTCLSPPLQVPSRMQHSSAILLAQVFTRHTAPQKVKVKISPNTKSVFWRLLAKW